MLPARLQVRSHAFSTLEEVSIPQECRQLGYSSPLLKHCISPAYVPAMLALKRLLIAFVVDLMRVLGVAEVLI